MHTHPYDKLTLDNGASLIFTPCPGTKGVDLTSSIQQLKAAGAQAIVTLMYDAEMKNNQANDLPIVCNKHSVQWFQLPIPDDDAPNEVFATAYKSHISCMLSILRNQGTVVVHCKGGSGRTGLIIGILMYELSYKKAEILSLIKKYAQKHSLTQHNFHFSMSFKK
ncbi:protein-tyrosine phosphatase family protein [Pseudoalteromonas sp. HM-SA03]|uniref:phosphatase domain-containing putative toxin n=1 Tax=Pseudoalteromonas sp. HM-SA03 TaxID=2029678 RepID=UPI0020D05A4A|nr:protein-tyrosine phosphatase family protein [Pseudoalteromonas sp. HM-SA03]